MEIEITYIIIAVLAALLGWTVRRDKRGAITIDPNPPQAAEPRTPPPPAEIKCENCAHWDQPALRIYIAKHPAFAEAARWVSPNEHSRSAAVVDTPEAQATYTPPEERKLLPIQEDSWDRFGACEIRQEGTHAIDHCTHFKARERAA
jgi:hypothetical protein